MAQERVTPRPPAPLPCSLARRFFSREIPQTGGVGIELEYEGEVKVFTPEQIVACMLTKVGELGRLLWLVSRGVAWRGVLPPPFYSSHAEGALRGVAALLCLLPLSLLDRVVLILCISRACVLLDDTWLHAPVWCDLVVVVYKYLVRESRKEGLNQDKSMQLNKCMCCILL